MGSSDLISGLANLWLNWSFNINFEEFGFAASRFCFSIESMGDWHHSEFMSFGLHLLFHSKEEI